MKYGQPRYIKSNYFNFAAFMIQIVLLIIENAETLFSIFYFDDFGPQYLFKKGVHISTEAVPVTLFIF